MHEQREDANGRSHVEADGAGRASSEDDALEVLGVPLHTGLTDEEWQAFLYDVVGGHPTLDHEFEVYLNGYRDAPEVLGG